MDLLRQSEPDPKQHQQLELIRQVILDTMACVSNEQTPAPQVWAKVRQAQDIQTLWYLRSDVMHLLSIHNGEEEAGDKLNEITALFQSHLPSAQFASFRRRGGQPCAPMKKGP
jgi:hypothetical protein